MDKSMLVNKFQALEHLCADRWKWKGPKICALLCWVW